MADKISIFGELQNVTGDNILTDASGVRGVLEGSKTVKEDIEKLNNFRDYSGIIGEKVDRVTPITYGEAQTAGNNEIVEDNGEGEITIVSHYGDKYEWGKSEPINSRASLMTLSPIRFRASVKNNSGTSIAELTLNSAGMSFTGDNASLYSNVDISGDLRVAGNIIQSGVSYETHAEKLFTANDYIVLREHAYDSEGKKIDPPAMTNKDYVGLIAKNYDGETDGALLYDNKGYARVGDISWNSDGSVDVSKMQKLVVRKNEMSSGKLILWNEDEERIETVSKDYISALDLYARALKVTDDKTLIGYSSSGNIDDKIKSLSDDPEFERVAIHFDSAGKIEIRDKRNQTIISYSNAGKGKGEDTNELLIKSTLKKIDIQASDKVQFREGKEFNIQNYSTFRIKGTYDVIVADANVDFSGRSLGKFNIGNFHDVQISSNEIKASSEELILSTFGTASGDLSVSNEIKMTAGEGLRLISQGNSPKGIRLMSNGGELQVTAGGTYTGILNVNRISGWSEDWAINIGSKPIYCNHSTEMDFAIDHAGLFISQGFDEGETSGISFSGDYIAMWSPCDTYALRYFDEDTGKEVFNIRENGDFYGDYGTRRCAYIDEVNKAKEEAKSAANIPIIDLR